MPIPSYYPAAAAGLLQELIKKLMGSTIDPWSLVVYGSLARGVWRVDHSDINLVAVFTEVSPEVLRTVRPALRQAWRKGRVETMILEREQIPRIADSFPVKLLQILWHHHVLVGEDPFAGVQIQPQDLRVRLEQEIRNHLLRLRHNYVMAADSPPTLARVIRTSVSSLVVELSTLLHLRGFGVPNADEAIFSLASQNLGVNEAVLTRLAEFRRGEPSGDMEELYFELLALVDRLARQVDELEVVSA